MSQDPKGLGELIDFEPEFQVFDIVPTLEEKMGIKIPGDPNSNETLELLLVQMEKHGISVSSFEYSRMVEHFS